MSNKKIKESGVACFRLVTMKEDPIPDATSGVDGIGISTGYTTRETKNRVWRFAAEMLHLQCIPTASLQGAEG